MGLEVRHIQEVLGLLAGCHGLYHGPGLGPGGDLKCSVRNYHGGDRERRMDDARRRDAARTGPLVYTPTF